jgi:hypothetical protein
MFFVDDATYIVVAHVVATTFDVVVDAAHIDDCFR